MQFQLESPFKPTGDQPQAIASLIAGIQKKHDKQVLLGVTGSGKTFTMSNVIAQIQKPTLIISHNKTLAAQLYQEFRDFFPNNAVSYFVSYYDYYQPEAYLPTTDTYIEKETQINDDIDRLRLAATTNLLTRPDVIVIASVSCIYNLGSPVEYAKHQMELIVGEIISRETIFLQLSNLQYQRSDVDLKRATFRVRGESIQLWPAYKDTAYRISMFGNTIESIDEIDPTTGDILPSIEKKTRFTIFPAKHYVADGATKEESLKAIEHDLNERLKQMRDAGKIIEAYRLEQRVSHDIDMIREIGFVNGIENYSRYFDGRNPGDPPFTLIDHFAENAKTFGDGSFLTIIDESHITVPQIRGMYNGDQSRKQTLVEYGFRLPSALDNRPLKFDEFMRTMKDMVFVSATPADWEMSISKNRVVEQLVRPTGILDPAIEIRRTEGQIPDLVKEIRLRKEKKQRTLVTTLTKRMAEALTSYMQENEKDLLVQYLHSDIETLERSDILQDLRKGVFDVVIGINLLREGLDLPEVSLVAILDADKEGFLRSTTSLIQTMGRAARHMDGRVIMYADKETDSMKRAIAEIDRRREIQRLYNIEHHITPISIQKPLRDEMIARVKDEDLQSQYNTGVTKGKKIPIELSKKEIILLEDIHPDQLTPEEKKKYKRAMTRSMHAAAKVMDFERAANIRDKIRLLG